MTNLPKLTGNRSQCMACGEVFNSAAAFDKHRTGPFRGGRGSLRRCLSVDEMHAAGFVRNASGYWTTGAYPMFIKRETHEYTHAGGERAA